MSVKRLERSKLLQQSILCLRILNSQLHILRSRKICGKRYIIQYYAHLRNSLHIVLNYYSLPVCTLHIIFVQLYCSFTRQTATLQTTPISVNYSSQTIHEQTTHKD